MTDQQAKSSCGQIAAGRTTALLGIGLCVAVLVSSGCRHDSIDRLTLDAGDAIATNKAVHTIDPWPPRAFRRHQTTNGKRIADAYESYQAKPPVPTAGAPTSTPDTQ